MRSAVLSVGIGIDRTVKQYIGGKQARPDSGYSFPVYAANGDLVGEAPLGNRKDIRNAVEAARARGEVGQDTRRMDARRCCTSSPRTWCSGARRSCRSWRVCRAGAGGDRVRLRRRAGVQLCGVVRQVRRLGAQPAVPDGDAGDEGSRRHGRRFCAPTMLRCWGCCRWCCRRLRWATPSSRCRASVRRR